MKQREEKKEGRKGEGAATASKTEQGMGGGGDRSWGG